MNNDDFNELAGRIQALGDYVISLTECLETNHMINGEHFTRRIQYLAENRYFEGEQLEATKRTLDQLARFISEARQRRQQAQTTQRTKRRRYYR